MSGWTITTSDGRVLTGAIQGCGGVVEGRARQLPRMLAEIERATEGKPLGIYEPKTGHCLMYQGDDRIEAPLAGASIALADRTDDR